MSGTMENRISNSMTIKSLDIDSIYTVSAERTTSAFPLMSTAIQAGFPSPADDYTEGALDLNEHLIAHPSATFFVKTKGESMVGAGILPGDILIVDRALEPRHGSIVVAVVNDEFTVKRLFRKNGVVGLQAENPEYPSIRFEKGMELLIWGVVSGVTRKLT